MLKSSLKLQALDDTQMVLLRTFSDTIVIECDWWTHIYIYIRFTRKDNLIYVFLRTKIKLQFSLVG